ncbi:MAG TPA: serine hydroxymethyltransferase [Candidatus Pacearchaeota archaeon]|nr:serine hydroxymethyltransferase [Candidatus Parcubacteria bacterium]HOU45879.1 serine hydroxymethyltransferase [Candidatus Pacearchaeota archaeon]HQI74330.1 serine hydroxymethyltransferase [Candidatus Pacearchaeota archaeon]
MKELLKKHEKWRSECINLIASENLISKTVRDAYNSDLMGRYAEGLPGKRFYQGLKYFDQMETLCAEAFKKEFKANFVDVRPISGAVANLAVFSGLFKRGDTILTLGLTGGSHISHEKIGAAGLSGLNVEHLPISPDGTIDLPRAKSMIEKLKPAGIILGGSVIVFEQPVKELSVLCKKIGTKVIYDGAHVFGLILAKVFQNPLDLGADILLASTHKTFPGPPGGIIIGNLNDDEIKNIAKRVFPGILSSHHIHHVPALYIALKEFQKNGKRYGIQVVKNAKAFAKELDKAGFNVLYKEKGFTQTHQVLLDVVKQGGGAVCAQILEDCNIICNKNMIPGDQSALNPGGLRLGVQEMTRLGFKEIHFKQIASFFKMALIDKKNKKDIAKKVAIFRKKFKTIKM